ncbi:WGxxGxxG family protein [Nostoc sp. FACHB-110]|uniref:WGxxGxxG family protein n=1 Tax=Nostoc sp. FACHB-110 TaxID=2692834 RepID=UPI0016877B2E|nr:WGxxGxxG family protein [Nostoc sp. FACHB-110]MBD2438706.1 WGxxGxxG-CTERM domain-containing protein [Nostoc sp. FACHB-110]
MKSNITQALGMGLLTVGMAILPLTVPVQAQVNSTPSTTDNPQTNTTDNRNDFDWGWLGLLGLIGLAGLAGKKRNDETTRYRDPSTTGSSTYRE